MADINKTQEADTTLALCKRRHFLRWAWRLGEGNVFYVFAKLWLEVRFYKASSVKMHISVKIRPSNRGRDKPSSHLPTRIGLKLTGPSNFIKFSLCYGWNGKMAGECRNWSIRVNMFPFQSMLISFLLCQLSFVTESKMG